MFGRTKEFLFKYLLRILTTLLTIARLFAVHDWPTFDQVHLALFGLIFAPPSRLRVVIPLTPPNSTQPINTRPATRLTPARRNPPVGRRKWKILN